MAEKIHFKAVTGSCRFCGSNQYHFDEKEQTFVCEYCGAEVYMAEEPITDDTTTEDISYDESEPKTEREDNENDASYLCVNRVRKGTVTILTGLIMVALPIIFNATGLLSADATTDAMLKALSIMLVFIRCIGFAEIVMGLWHLIQGFAGIEIEV